MPRPSQRRSNVRLRCAVPGCRYNRGKGKVLKNTTLFCIPKDERRNDWIKAIKPEDPKYPHLMVCKLHFADDDIVLNKKRKRIIYGAMPTRNLPESGEGPEPPVHQAIEEDILEEVKSEPDDGAVVDLFTEEETVVQKIQKRTLESDDLSEIPVKREKEDSYEDGEASIIQPSYRYDEIFPRPIQIQDQSAILDEKIESNSNATELDLLIRLSKAYLNPELAKFVEVQAILKSELKAAFKRKRYNKDVLFFALKLYHKYPQTYELMQESFYLPPLLKIKQLCRNLNWEMNESWMTVLRARFQYASTEERECVVCVAKVRLSLGLSYDPVRDRIAGLYEMNGSQRPRTARYATVVYARGIISRWRQPLSYALLPSGFRQEDVWCWYENLLTNLFDIGLNVRAVITDFDDDYNTSIRPLSSLKTYFQLNDKQIYCFYDCTQLMVKLRDCFKMYNVNFKGMVAEWDVIEELFEFDSSRRYKLGAGLTAEHVKPSGSAARKTKLAIETLSPKVASALAAAVDIRVLDDSAHGTVKFVETFSTFYDILHNKELPALDKVIHSDMKFLHDMLMHLEKLSFKDKREMRSVQDPGVIGAFSKDVRSIMALQERMRRAGYKSLPLRAFNNDPLHQFFDRLKGVNKKDPTGRQVVDGFRRNFVFNIMKSFCKMGKLDDFLQTARGIKNVAMEPEAPKMFKGLVKPSHVALLTRVKMSPDILLAQCLRLKPCCELGQQFCKNPPAVFIEYVSDMERCFKQYFAPETLAEGVIATILASLDEFQFPAPCRCFPVLLVITLYLRFRIANLVEYNNTKFRRGISRDFTMNVKINAY
ncbi:uncharacterized protein LOC134673074 [Cydia fagiglandana]|uniref:uncharacterized protein LOC134673074 n=1 Tax=Cydia fagiglandana TaxID=1458189 RepID=UPI002FEE2C91